MFFFLLKLRFSRYVDSFLVLSTLTVVNSLLSVVLFIKILFVDCLTVGVVVLVDVELIVVEVFLADDVLCLCLCFRLVLRFIVVVGIVVEEDKADDKVDDVRSWDDLREVITSNVVAKAEGNGVLLSS